MVSLNDVYAIVGAYGLGRVLPAGSTRAAVRKIIETTVRTGRAVAPQVARGGSRLAMRHPLGAAALLGYGAHQAGYLDPVYEQVSDLPDVIIPALEEGVKRVRKKSGFNKGVAAGMKAVRLSKNSFGKKGTINNSKRAFSTVTKVVSALRKGGKMPKSGVRRQIGLAAKRYV